MKLEVDEDMAFWLRDIMATILKAKCGPIRCGTKDSEYAEEMLNIIPSDVKPYQEPWLRDLDVRLE